MLGKYIRVNITKKLYINIYIYIYIYSTIRKKLKPG